MFGLRNKKINFWGYTLLHRSKICQTIMPLAADELQIRELQKTHELANLSVTRPCHEKTRHWGILDSIFYIPSTIFQLLRNGSSWVEPVLS